MQLGDIAVALGYLDLRFPDVDWRSRHPGLVPSAERMFARSSLRDTQPLAGQADREPAGTPGRREDEQTKDLPPSPLSWTMALGKVT